MGKPIADKGLNCPLWRKDVSKVCHTCAWYGPITGVHPQTGERVDAWQCAITSTVLAVLETAKCAAEGGAATQELRNDMHVDRQAQTRLLLTQIPNNNSNLRLTDDRHADG